ncbi:hypothetical protein [Halocalculus aciditolerans]|uniref:ABC-2 type transport system permease protein n=1 Tax=Halocalculus aciditolerans TaxID=1383812 RepID=A0A830F3U1_9EURY|nr:hypothetical protein [Halocalculus aciditolerans]GGL59911.1 hypothetical protein GCM10009039_17690 [Halocalculus aciditolerans]
MSGSDAWTYFQGMLREEWRLHANLFGGARFAAFPVFVALVGGLTVWALTRTGTSTGSLVLGVHALVALFGLQTGAVGFVTRDAMRDLLGDVTLLVFTSRTLPVSQRRLLAVFLAKDAVYYAALFLAPVTVALAPALGVAALPWLWATLVCTFTLGAAATLALIAASTHGRRGKLAAGLVAVLLGLAVAAGVPVLDYTPIALYETPGLASALGTLLSIGALAAIGVGTYDTEYVRPARTAESAYYTWKDRIPDADSLLVKTLLDVARSAGGFWKVGLTAGIVFAVAYYLVDLVDALVGVRPTPGVAFGAILSLTAFTTYNWLTQYDDMDFYLLYPTRVRDLFRAKRQGFLVVGGPVALLLYAAAVVLLGATHADAVAGLAILCGTGLYLFGLTVYVAGFDPNELLFDTLVFALYTGGIIVGLVPPLVASIAFDVTPVAAFAYAGWAVVLAAGGHLAFQRAIPRWRQELRA